MKEKKRRKEDSLLECAMYQKCSALSRLSSLPSSSFESLSGDIKSLWWEVLDVQFSFGHPAPNTKQQLIFLLLLIVVAVVVVVVFFCCFSNRVLQLRCSSGSLIRSTGNSYAIASRRTSSVVLFREKTTRTFWHCAIA